MSKDANLETIVGDIEPEKVGYLQIAFRSPTIEELPGALREFAKILKSIYEKKGDESKKLATWEVLELAADSTQSAVNVIKYFTTLSTEEINKIPFDELPGIAIEIVRRNLDFFQKKLMPAIQDLMAMMEQKTPGLRSLQG